MQQVGSVQSGSSGLWGASCRPPVANLCPFRRRRGPFPLIKNRQVVTVRLWSIDPAVQVPSRLLLNFRSHWERPKGSHDSRALFTFKVVHQLTAGHRLISPFIPSGSPSPTHCTGPPRVSSSIHNAKRHGSQPELYAPSLLFIVPSCGFVCYHAAPAPAPASASSPLFPDKPEPSFRTTVAAQLCLT